MILYKRIIIFTVLVITVVSSIDLYDERPSDDAMFQYRRIQTQLGERYRKAQDQKRFLNRLYYPPQNNIPHPDDYENDNNAEYSPHYDRCRPIHSYGLRNQQLFGNREEFGSQNEVDNNIYNNDHGETLPHFRNMRRNRQYRRYHNSLRNHRMEYIDHSDGFPHIGSARMNIQDDRFHSSVRNHRMNYIDHSDHFSDIENTRTNVQYRNFDNSLQNFDDSLRNHRTAYISHKRRFSNIANIEENMPYHRFDNSLRNHRIHYADRNTASENVYQTYLGKTKITLHHRRQFESPYYRNNKLNRNRISLLQYLRNRRTKLQYSFRKRSQNFDDIYQFPENSGMLRQSLNKRLIRIRHSLSTLQSLQNRKGIPKSRFNIRLLNFKKCGVTSTKNGLRIVRCIVGCYSESEKKSTIISPSRFERYWVIGIYRREAIRRATIQNRVKRNISSTCKTRSISRRIIPRPIRIKPTSRPMSVRQIVRRTVIKTVQPLKRIAIKRQLRIQKPLTPVKIIYKKRTIKRINRTQVTLQHQNVQNICTTPAIPIRQIIKRKIRRIQVLRVRHSTTRPLNVRQTRVNIPSHYMIRSTPRTPIRRTRILRPRAVSTYNYRIKTPLRVRHIVKRIIKRVYRVQRVKQVKLIYSTARPVVTRPAKIYNTRRTISRCIRPTPMTWHEIAIPSQYMITRPRRICTFPIRIIRPTQRLKLIKRRITIRRERTLQIIRPTPRFRPIVLPTRSIRRIRNVDSLQTRNVQTITSPRPISQVLVRHVNPIRRCLPTRIIRTTLPQRPVLFTERRRRIMPVQCSPPIQKFRIVSPLKRIVRKVRYAVSHNQITRPVPVCIRRPVIIRPMRLQTSRRVRISVSRNRIARSVPVCISKPVTIRPTLKRIRISVSQNRITRPVPVCIPKPVIIRPIIRPVPLSRPRRLLIRRINKPTPIVLQPCKAPIVPSTPLPRPRPVTMRSVRVSTQRLVRVCSKRSIVPQIPIYSTIRPTSRRPISQVLVRHVIPIRRCLPTRIIRTTLPQRPVLFIERRRRIMPVPCSPPIQKFRIISPLKRIVRKVRYTVSHNQITRPVPVYIRRPVIIRPMRLQTSRRVRISESRNRITRSVPVNIPRPVIIRPIRLQTSRRVRISVSRNHIARPVPVYIPRPVIMRQMRLQTSKRIRISVSQNRITRPVPVYIPRPVIMRPRRFQTSKRVRISVLRNRIARSVPVCNPRPVVIRPMRLQTSRRVRISVSRNRIARPVSICNPKPVIMRPMRLQTSKRIRIAVSRKRITRPVPHSIPMPLLTLPTMPSIILPTMPLITLPTMPSITLPCFGPSPAHIHRNMPLTNSVNYEKRIVKRRRTRIRIIKSKITTTAKPCLLVRLLKTQKPSCNDDEDHEEQKPTYDKIVLKPEVRTVYKPVFVKKSKRRQSERNRLKVKRKKVSSIGSAEEDEEDCNRKPLRRRRRKVLSTNSDEEHETNGNMKTARKGGEGEEVGDEDEDKSVRRKRSRRRKNRGIKIKIKKTISVGFDGEHKEPFPTRIRRKSMSNSHNSDEEDEERGRRNSMRMRNKSIFSTKIHVNGKTVHISTGPSASHCNDQHEKGWYNKPDTTKVTIKKSLSSLKSTRIMVNHVRDNHGFSCSSKEDH